MENQWECSARLDSFRQEATPKLVHCRYVMSKLSFSHNFSLLLCAGFDNYDIISQQASSIIVWLHGTNSSWMKDNTSVTLFFQELACAFFFLTETILLPAVTSTLFQYRKHKCMSHHALCRSRSDHVSAGIFLTVSQQTRNGYCTRPTHLNFVTQHLVELSTTEADCVCNVPNSWVTLFTNHSTNGITIITAHFCGTLLMLETFTDWHCAIFKMF